MTSYYGHIVSGNIARCNSVDIAEDFEQFPETISMRFINELTLDSEVKNITNAARAEDLKYLHVKVGGATCRESLLDWLRTCYESLRKYSSPYYITSIFVEIIAEQGKKIHELDKHRELIMSFSERFLDSGLYKVSYRNNRLFLGQRIFSSSYVTGLYILSFLLWIFRNDFIMEYCLENYTDKEPVFQEFMMFLSKCFLKYTSWGTFLNSSISLSVFCYIVSRGKYLANGFNGPVSASSYASLDALADYLTDIYLPTFPEDGKFISERFSPSESSILCRGFQKLLPALYLEKSQKGNNNEL